jgi:hypothetical protein
MLSPILGPGIIEMTPKITISLPLEDRHSTSIWIFWFADCLVGFMSRRIGLSATLPTDGISMCQIIALLSLSLKREYINSAVPVKSELKISLL